MSSSYVYGLLILSWALCMHDMIANINSEPAGFLLCMQEVGTLGSVMQQAAGHYVQKAGGGR